MNLPGWIPGLLEPDPRKLVPYAGHYRANIAMLFGGAALTMYRLHGLPFELEPNTNRNGRADRLNTLLRAIADPDLTICIHLVHHLRAAPAPQPISTNRFVRELMADYERVALTGLFVNDWYITMVAEPAPDQRRFWRRWWPEGTRPRTIALDPDREQLLEDTGHLLETTLAEYGIRRLGLGEHQVSEDFVLPITEIGTALYAIRNAHEMIIPHTTGTLGNSVYSDPAGFEARRFAPNIPGLENRVGAILGFENYPGHWRVGMFNALLGVAFPFVLHHSFRFTLSHRDAAALKLTRKQMIAAGDEAGDLIEGLGEAINKSTSMKTARGKHNFSLAVYADDYRNLNHNVATASRLLQEHGGANPVRELNVWKQGALMASYFGQQPGYRGPRPRQGKLSGTDLVAMASLDNYPTGQASGWWGPSQIRFKTNGHTAYDYVSHVGEVGHKAIVGSSEAGKTVFIGVDMCVQHAPLGRDGICLLIDKDQSNRLTIEALGGTYSIMCRGVASGLAPLVAYPDTARTRAFLHGLYTWCIERDGKGKIATWEDTRLARGIARQLVMPPHQRSMGGVRELLGYGSSDTAAGPRFERWCQGGTMGWLLDNREHVIDIGPGYHGIDFTDLIPDEKAITDDGACSVTAKVIAHQLAEKMDGRRIAAYFDECRFYIEPLGKLIEDQALTGRKMELACTLIFQQPEHLTDSAVGPSLIAQLKTKILFPGVNYKGAALRKLEVAPAAIRMLKTDMTLGKARRFLLWRGPGQSAVCEFDLTNLPQLPVLAGRASTTRLWDRVIEAGGDTDEFLRRLANPEKVDA